MIEIKVLGEPKALKRHRMGRGFSYDPSAGDKQTFAQIVQANAPEEPLSIPLRVEMIFYFSRPKSHFGTGKNAGNVKPGMSLYHTARPDIDNLIKFVLDSLNGIFWKDDCYVSQINAAKVYTTGTPMTIVRVYESDLPKQSK